MHITQLAYYVADAKVAAQHWVATHNAGPFYIAEHIALENVVFEGQPTTLDHTSAYGWCGNIMIELVQQNCAKPSVFSARDYGLHHCAYFAPNLDQELARLAKTGSPTSMTANTASGVKFAFATNSAGSGLEAVAPLGHYLEIYEDQAGLRSFYAKVEQDAANWNGEDPLRTL